MSIEKMSIEQIRSTLSNIEASISIALDNHASYEFSEFLLIQRDAYWNQLVKLIQSKDPHTTEADISYFESCH